MDNKTGETIAIILFCFFFILPVIDYIFMELFPDHEIIIASPLYLFFSLTILLIVLFINAMIQKSREERKNIYLHIKFYFYIITILLGIILFVFWLLKKLY